MNKREVILAVCLFFLIIMFQFSFVSGEQCADSDGNLSIEEQSFVSGGVSYSDGDFRTNFIDWCEKGKVILEHICKNGKPETIGMKCENGCEGGYCIRENGNSGAEVYLPDDSLLPKNFSFDGLDCENKIKNQVIEWLKPFKTKASKEICPNGKLVGSLDFNIEVSNLRRGLPGPLCTAFAVIEKPGAFRCQINSGFWGWLRGFFI